MQASIASDEAARVLLHQPRVGARFVREERLRRAVLHDPPRLHHQHAVAARDGGGLVRDEQDRRGGGTRA